MADLLGADSPLMDQLDARAHDAVDLGKKAGADDVWASAVQTRSVEFSHRDGALEKAQESTSRSLHLRLYVDGRYSVHVTTDLRPERLGQFIDNACALTRALEPDPFRSIPDPGLFEGRSGADLGLVDQGLLQPDRDERLAWCNQMNSGIAAQDSVISTTSHTVDGIGAKAVASSNGFTGQWRGTTLWMGAEVTLRDEGDVRPEGYMWAGARRLSDVPTPQWIADEAYQSAAHRLGSKKGPTRKTTMVVDPRAGGRLLSALLAPASASGLAQRRSFWAGKVGEPLASDVLTVVDDPLLPGGIASRWFDGEGISARPLTLIEGGVAKNLYVDTYYGAKTKMTPTTGQASNIVVAPGEQGQEAILKDVGEGILVTSWLGGNSDATTGDFSFGMRGHLIENGQIAAPVGEMNVTGNLVDLFRRLVTVGNDPWPYSTRHVPTLVFADVSFSGG